MVLEKILSALDSKEIKPVNLKGNQPWIFIGRTDAEAKAPVLWPPDVKSWLIGKDHDAAIKLPTSAGSSKKQESSRKTSISAFDYAKAFDCVDHNKLWKILKEMGVPDHLTCLLRNLYAG